MCSSSQALHVQHALLRVKCPRAQVLRVVARKRTCTKTWPGPTPSSARTYVSGPAHEDRPSKAFHAVHLTVHCPAERARTLCDGRSFHPPALRAVGTVCGAGPGRLRAERLRWLYPLHYVSLCAAATVVVARAPTAASRTEHRGMAAPKHFALLTRRHSARWMLHGMPLSCQVDVAWHYATQLLGAVPSHV
jgi:hypothetical protein